MGARVKICFTMLKQALCDGIITAAQYKLLRARAKRSDRNEDSLLLLVNLLHSVADALRTYFKCEPGACAEEATEEATSRTSVHASPLNDNRQSAESDEHEANIDIKRRPFDPASPKEDRPTPRFGPMDPIRVNAPLSPNTLHLYQPGSKLCT